MAKKKKKDKYVKPMLKMAVGNLIAIPLIGATAGAVNTLPGTAKSVVGIVPGLQSVSLVSHNLKMLPKGKMKKGKKKSYY